MSLLKNFQSSTVNMYDPTAIVREDRPIYNITRAGANTLFGLNYAEDSAVVGFNLAGDIYNFVDVAPEWEKTAVADYVRKTVLSISGQVVHAITNTPDAVRSEVFEKVLAFISKGAKQ